MAFPRDEEKRATIAELHAQGLGDAEIARRMGELRHSVRDMRVAMGLATNGYGRRPVASFERKTAVDRFLEACEACGLAAAEDDDEAKRAGRLGRLPSRHVRTFASSLAVL